MGDTKRNLMKNLKKLASLDVDKYVRRPQGKVEENVKIKLTVPLLELLGYDVQKDMDFEHHVRDKRADIALLFGNTPKLIIETKDLDENLDHHLNQALDYAFNKGVDWVILTNGVEIRLYKSYITGLSPADREIFSTRLDELPQTFSHLADRISKQNLRTAEKITKEAEEVRQTVTANILIKDLAECKERLFRDLSDQFKIRYDTDKDFKDVIDAWAERVDMNMEDRHLIHKLCTEGAYTLINRLLFLRICEDRGHVKAKLHKEALARWKEMVEKPSGLLGLAFREIADRFEGLYKAPLFDDIRYEDVKWDEQTIRFILETLGEHDFRQITKDILGRAYEQHITKRERKELGQFYTPDFVIDYILERVDVAPQKKILDPACGSGGFLLKAYDQLRERYEQEGWGDEDKHHQILSRNLYGVDINPFATQLTLMNLFLKDLDHPTSAINIAEGDTLERLENSFDFDYFEKDTPLSRLSVGDKRFSHAKVLREAPFDTVVGNPPYISYGLRGTGKLTKKRLAYLKQAYPNSAEYKISIYAIFMQRAIELVKVGGKLGFVVPDSFLLGRYFSKLRKYILDTCSIVEVVLFQKDFWKYGVVGRPVIIILKKEPSAKKRTANKLTAKRYWSTADLQSHKCEAFSYEQSYFGNILFNRFRLFFDKESLAFVRKMEAGSSPLGGRDGSVSIHTGARSKIGQSKIIGEAKKGRNWRRGLISGGQVSRYRLDYQGHFLNIDPKLLHGGGWNPNVIERDKLLIRQTSDSLVATYDDDHYYHLNNLHSIAPRRNHEALKYLLAILNSALMNHYYHVISLEVGRTMAQTDIETLEQLPIKMAAKRTQKALARLVDQILCLNRNIMETTSAGVVTKLNSQIELVDQKIEKQVRKIYGFA